MPDNRDIQPLRPAAEQFDGLEIGQLVEPQYPILDKDEVWDGITDLRDQLTAEERAWLRPEETVIHIHERELALPDRPVTAEEILMKAARADAPRQIGYHGPTVASVGLIAGQPQSRYERQHGRDGLIAADDVKHSHPKLLDAEVVSLAGLQGLEDEPFIPGQPYGFERPGAIILVNFAADDPLGLKFQTRKDWKRRFYGSADAPGLFVNAIADLQAADPGYLFRRTYDAIDGTTYVINHAFDLSVKWLLDRMRDNPEGLVEYHNPYTNGRGMRNQGWKDSADAMVHKNGDWVNAVNGVAPIEIQCQAVISLRKAASIYRGVYENIRLARLLEDRADGLLRFILEKGWVEDERGGYFAMGWDRDEAGRPRRIETRSIDMHSVLRVLDMEDPEHKAMTREVVRTLTGEDMFTRWGSRVMSSREKAYGDLRYHCSVWPDKSNRVAESIGSAGLFGLDRFMGGRTTRLIEAVGCIPEHISGQDSEYPIIPTKDVYVYDRRYNEVHLAEQAPPLGQTWGASSEIGKRDRYRHTPPQAFTAEDQQFESTVVAALQERLAS